MRSPAVPLPHPKHENADPRRAMETWPRRSGSDSRRARLPRIFVFRSSAIRSIRPIRRCGSGATDRANRNPDRWERTPSGRGSEANSRRSKRSCARRVLRPETEDVRRLQGRPTPLSMGVMPMAPGSGSGGNARPMARTNGHQGGLSCARDRRARRHLRAQGGHQGCRQRWHHAQPDRPAGKCDGRASGPGRSEGPRPGPPLPCVGGGAGTPSRVLGGE